MFFQNLKKWQKWVLGISWASVLLMIVGIWILFYNVSRDNLPTFEELENPKYNLASIVIDANGNPLESTI